MSEARLAIVGKGLPAAATGHWAGVKRMDWPDGPSDGEGQG